MVRYFEPQKLMISPSNAQISIITTILAYNKFIGNIFSKLYLFVQRLVSIRNLLMLIDSTNVTLIDITYIEKH